MQEHEEEADQQGLAGGTIGCERVTIIMSIQRVVVVSRVSLTEIVHGQLDTDLGVAVQVGRLQLVHFAVKVDEAAVVVRADVAIELKGFDGFLAGARWVT